MGKQKKRLVLRNNLSTLELLDNLFSGVLTIRGSVQC